MAYIFGERNQSVLFPSSVEDYIPATDPECAKVKDKQAFTAGYNVKAEASLFSTAFNLQRIISILGVEGLIQKLNTI